MYHISFIQNICVQNLFYEVDKQMQLDALPKFRNVDLSVQAIAFNNIHSIG